MKPDETRLLLTEGYLKPVDADSPPHLNSRSTPLTNSLNTPDVNLVVTQQLKFTRYVYNEQLWQCDNPVLLLSLGGESISQVSNFWLRVKDISQDQIHLSKDHSNITVTIDLSRKVVELKQSEQLVSTLPISDSAIVPPDVRLIFSNGLEIQQLPNINRIETSSGRVFRRDVFDTTVWGFTSAVPSAHSGWWKVSNIQRYSIELVHVSNNIKMTIDLDKEIMVIDSVPSDPVTLYVIDPVVKVTANKLTCTGKDDSGSEEEFFGKLWVEHKSRSRTLWQHTSSNPVDLKGGDSFDLHATVTLYGVLPEEAVTIKGHLRELDDGSPNDDLKEHATTVYLKDIAEPDKEYTRTMTFTEGGTTATVDVGYTTATKKYLIIDSVTCDVSSRSTDAEVGEGLVLGAAVGGLLAAGLAVAATGGGAAVAAGLVLGTKSSMFAMVVTGGLVGGAGTAVAHNNGGEDDLYITRNLSHFWPASGVVGINPKQTMPIEKRMPLVESLSFELWEHDDLNKDDDLGFFTIDESHPVTGAGHAMGVVVKSKKEGTSYLILYRVVEE